LGEEDGAPIANRYADMDTNRDVQRIAKAKTPTFLSVTKVK
jgi:hypothetical protein